MTQLASHRALQALARQREGLNPHDPAAIKLRIQQEEVLKGYVQEPLTIWQKHAEIIAKGEF